MDVACARAAAITGRHLTPGQTALADLVNERFEEKLSPQAVQNLCSRTVNKRTGKLAQTSKYTWMFAKVVGLRVDWLAKGKGPMNEPGWRPPAHYLEPTATLTVIPVDNAKSKTTARDIALAKKIGALGEVGDRAIRRQVRSIERQVDRAVGTRPTKRTKPGPR